MKSHSDETAGRDLPPGAAQGANPAGNTSPAGGGAPSTPGAPADAGAAGEPAGLDFIRQAVKADLQAGKNDGRVQTRFPPEPNGYLHIGHAKAFGIDFGVADDFGGACNLRFDDTNPEKEDVEYVESIQEDIRWLGYDWQDRLFYASDYFEQIYLWAEQLVQAGKAYVDDLSAEQIREHRGTLTEPGRESPYRNRTVEENLDLFRRMRAGEFPDGSRVLRAKIDMAAANINLRDPVMYRIRRIHHHRTGDAWCIYPSYDWAHGQSDAIEGITHSLCSLEFEDHRPLYDWFLDQIDLPRGRPRQIEFARLRLTYTVMSKRKLRALVEEGVVSGWDDPRMPTLSGLRRLGYTPEGIRLFLDRIGVAKRDSIVDVQLLEHCIREDLNRHAPRVMAVLRPLRLVIDNYPEGESELVEVINNPEDPAAGTRQVPFSRTLWIERDDFREEPPKGYHRLYPGNEVRLRAAFIVRCTGLVKGADGEVSEVHCTYDPDTRGGSTPDGRKVKGTIHWVSEAHGVKLQARLYDRLFAHSEPDGEECGDFRRCLNPASLETLSDCWGEPALAAVPAGYRCQFERLGYFCADLETRPGAPVFNRTVSLRDSWAKVEKKQGA